MSMQLVTSLRRLPTHPGTTQTDGVYSCPLCGTRVGWFDASIHSAESRWASEFFGLYRDFDGEVVLTGLGLDTVGNGHYHAPPDPSARHDDPGYTRIGTELIDDTTGPYLTVNGRHGFVIHNSCWRLFLGVLSPSISLDPGRLFDVVSSFPVSNKTVDWGHSYGGSNTIREGVALPDLYFWDPWMTYFPSGTPLPDENFRILTERQCNYLYYHPRLPPEQLPVSDPFPPTGLSFPGDRIAFERELEKFVTRSRRPTGHGANVSIERRNGGDLLCKLPLELTIMIAQLLPTADFLNARRASRAFWDPFHCGDFWRSRFWTGGQRDWLFDVRSAPHTAPVDFRLLHRLTAGRHLNDTLRNRRRISELSTALQPLINAQWESSFTDTYSLEDPPRLTKFALYEVRERVDDVMPPVEAMEVDETHEADETDTLVVNADDTDANDPDWEEVEVPRPRNAIIVFQQFETDSLVLREVEFHLPAQFDSIRLHYCKVFNVRYICGMNVWKDIDKNYEDTVDEGGYTSKDTDLFIRPRDGRLIGLSVAMGPQGVRALQFHCKMRYGRPDEVSEWFGDCGGYDCVKTYRMTTRERVTVIRCSFDGCKMVGIGTGEDVLPENLPQGHLVTKKTLREAALWHSNVPGPHLSLNDTCIVKPNREKYTIGPNPLVWTLFGGHGGVLLPRLTGISVTSCMVNPEARISCVFAVEFTYDGENPVGRPNTMELGQPIEQLTPRRAALMVPVSGPRTLPLCLQSFAIDGPGGERIKAFRARTYDDALTGFDVLTTHDRMKVFGERISTDDECYNHRFQHPEPGTTITGFYAHRWSYDSYHFGYTYLGIISEAIRN